MNMLVKKSLCFLMAMMLLIGTGVIGNISFADIDPSLPNLVISVPKTEFNVNETFNVDILFTNSTKFNAAQITLAFDKSKVQVVDSENNPVDSETSQYMDWLIERNDFYSKGKGIFASTGVSADNEKGLVDYSIYIHQDQKAITPPFQVTGNEFKIVTFRFKTIALGDPNIHFPTSSEQVYNATNPTGYIVQADPDVSTNCNLVVPTVTVIDPAAAKTKAINDAIDAIKAIHADNQLTVNDTTVTHARALVDTAMAAPHNAVASDFVVDSVDYLALLTAKETLMTQIGTAAAAVTKAETSKAQADIDAAQALVTALIDGAAKTELQGKLDALTAAGKLAAATAAVAKAEGSKLQADIDAAQALVTALPDGTDKTALQARIDAVQVIVDKIKAAVDAIAALPAVDAIKYPDSKAAIEAARALVTVAKAAGALDTDITNLSTLEAAEARLSELAKPFVIELVKLDRNGGTEIAVKLNKTDVAYTGNELYVVYEFIKGTEPVFITAHRFDPTQPIVDTPIYANGDYTVKVFVLESFSKTPDSIIDKQAAVIQTFGTDVTK